MKDFSARHVEAANGIVRVYSYFNQYRKWPSKGDVESPANRWFASGWSYETDPGQGVSEVWLHGANHMSIIYEFTQPTNGVGNSTWTLDQEGSETKFNAATPYIIAPSGLEERPH